MSTSIIEPGTRLAGRYRLQERVSETGGSTLWKALDEILARPVAVRTFDPDVPNSREVVTAARKASRLTDPRLTQVFDADDGGESAYVVSEWASGETLEEMLADRGPLDPGRAATLLHEAAEAIAAAHAAELAHLRLTPRDLLWTTGGTVKLLGIAVHAVLAESDTADPAGTALEDTRGIGRILYAALTAHWPGDTAQSSLPAAPTGDDGTTPRPPRQVRAGVPQALDALVCRALDMHLPEGQEALATPADLAKALAGVPRTPLPLFTGLTGAPPPAVLPRAPQQFPNQPGHHQDRTPADPRTAGRPAPDRRPPPAPARPPRHAALPGGTRQIPGQPPTGPTRPAGGPRHRPPGRARPQISRPLIAVAAAAVTVAVGVGAWQLGKDGSGDPGDAGPSADRDASPSARPPRALQIAAASGFDPTRPDHPDSSVPKNAHLVFDQSPTTDWHSQRYTSPAFGNLKGGLGVLLDMGRPVKVSKVRVTTADGGAALQLRVGSSREFGALDVVGRVTTSPGGSEITATGSQKGQYVLLWFTRLPQSLKASISDVKVFGTP